MMRCCIDKRDGNDMIVVDKNLGEYITIENMNFEDESEDPTKKDIEIYVGDATVTEGGALEFTVGINNTLEKDLVLNVESYFNGSASTDDLTGAISGIITINAGETSGTFTIDTLDDERVEPTENFIFAVTGLAKAYGGEILISNNLHADMREVA